MNTTYTTKKADMGDAMIGAGIGAALPASSYLDYSYRILPKEKRRIIELVDQAAREGKLFGSYSSNAYGGNELVRRMQLGDVILQSHKAGPLKPFSGSPDFVGLSLLGSGGSIPHAGMANQSGHIVHAGTNDNHDTLLGWLRKRIVHTAKNDGNAWSGSRFGDVWKRKKVESAVELLSRVGYDPVNVRHTNPEVAIGLRNNTPTTLSQKELARIIANEQDAPYGKTRAVLAGLRRILLPFGDKNFSWKKRRRPAWSCQGNFCSEGVNNMLSAMGAKAAPAGKALPPDFLHHKGLDLVGIGLNAPAIEKADEGLKGGARLASAAKNHMLEVLNQAKGLRRGAAAAAAGSLGILGGVVGGFLPSSKDGDS